MTFFLSALIVVGFLSMTIVSAAANDTAGWLWGGGENLTGGSTGIGWISLNSGNVGAGGGSYAVNISLFVDQKVAATGYAWSENMGWIDFNPQDHCTTGVPDASKDQYKAASCVVPVKADGSSYGIGDGGVFRTSNTSLAGWARFVSIAQATAAVPSNAGGYDGWIAIGIGNGYDVSISQSTGDMSGYGWSELGAIQFLGHAIVPPTVTIKSSDMLVNVRDLILPQTRTISWTSSSATSCDVVSKNSAGNTDGVWTATNIGTGDPVAASHDINITLGMNETFTITCSGEGGVDSKSVLITTACFPLECSNQICKDNTSSGNRRIGATAVSECMTNDLCKYDTDCQQRATSLNGWEEVAPQ